MIKFECVLLEGNKNHLQTQINEHMDKGYIISGYHNTVVNRKGAIIHSTIMTKELSNPMVGFTLEEQEELNRLKEEIQNDGETNSGNIYRISFLQDKFLQALKNGKVEYEKL